MATTEPSENGSAEAQKTESQTEPSESPVTTTSPSVTETSEPEISSTPQSPPDEATDPEAEATADSVEKKWPGWPGDCVFRLIVPVLKVGSIIGRKGDLIKKLCEETRARVRVLDGPVGSPDRIVLISGKEEPDAALSPAMDAVMRISKRVNGIPESEEDAKASEAAAVAFCSIRLLVASTQAINLIGKQGSLIKSMQESTGASIRVLSTDEIPTYGNSDERVVELQGEALKVLKALDAVVGHLRKFLVDHSVLPLFEKSYTTPVSQARQVETWADKSTLHTSSQTGISSDYSHSLKRDSLYLDRESNLDSQLSSSGLSLYGQDTGISGLRSLGRGRAGGPIVTQIAQTMQIPLAFAEDIIGIGGSNIAYIRRTSGAILTVQESRGLPEEITVEIKGTAPQVQTAQQLIQESVNSQKDVVPSSYGNIEPDSRSSYSQLGNTSYSSSSFGGQLFGQQYGQQYGRYGSSGLGGYSSYRM